MSSKDSKQTLTAIAAVIIIALLGITAFLLYNKYNQDKMISQQSSELNEAEKVKTELEKQYYEALSNLEEMKGENEEANALIEQQKLELKEEKSRIEKLIRSGKANKNDLVSARRQLEEFRVQLDQYMAEVNSLKEDKEILTSENTQLSEDKSMLEDEVSKERTMNESLVSEKAVLVSEKENLESIKSELSKKVNIASVIKVGKVHAVGLRTKENGKEAEKKKAKQVDKIRICFNTSVNEVTPGGDETFFIRVINPVGETMAIENLGSGVMVNNKTSEQIRYTSAKTIDYNSDEAMYCTNWDPGVAFQTGEYEIQVYNKGYLAGQGSLILK